MYYRQLNIASSLLVIVCLEGLSGKEQFSFISLVSGSRAGWRRRSRSGQETASTRSFAHLAWCLCPTPAPPGARRGLCPATRAAGGSSAALGEGWVEDGGCQVCARCLFWGGGGGSCCTELELGQLQVLHGEVPLPVLLREKWWMPCLSPSEGSGDEDEPLHLYSDKGQGSSAAAERWGEAPSSPRCQADGLPCSQSTPVFKVMPR